MKDTFCALSKETGNRSIQAKLNEQEFSKEAILTGKGSAQIRYLMRHKFTMKLKNCSSGHLQVKEHFSSSPI